MTVNLIPFDVAEHLKTDEDCAYLLSDALSTGHAGYIAASLGAIVRARGMTQIAREAGVTRDALYKSLTADGDPKLSTVLGVIRALGLDLKAVEKAGVPAG